MENNPEFFEQSTEDPSPAEVTAARPILALNPVASPINNHLSTEISENLSSATVRRPLICYYCHCKGHGTAHCHALQKDKEKCLVDQKGHNYFLPSGAWIPFDPVRPICSVVMAFQASSCSAPPFPAPYRISCGALQPWYPTTKPIPCADPPVSESYHCHLIRKSPNIKSSQPKVLSSDPPSPKCSAKFVKEANSVLKKIINLMVPGFSSSSLDNIHLPKSQIPKRTKARKVILRRHNGVKVSSLQCAPPGLDATKIVKTLSRATLVSNGQPSALDSPGVPDPTSSETLRDEVKLSSDPSLHSIPDVDHIGPLHPTEECLVSFPIDLRNEVKLSSNPSLHSVPDVDPIGQLHPTAENLVSFPITLRDEVKLSSDPSLRSVPDLDPIGQLRPTSECLVSSLIALRNEVKLSSNPSLCSVPDVDPIGQLRPTSENLVSSSTNIQDEVKLSSNPSLCSVPNVDPIGQLCPTSERLVSSLIDLRDQVKLSSDPSLRSVPDLDPIGQLRPTSECLVSSLIALRNEVNLSSNPSLRSVPDVDPIGQLRPTSENLVSSSTNIQDEVKLSSNPSLCSVPNVDPIGQLCPTSERLVSSLIDLQDQVKLSSDPSLRSIPNVDPIGQLRPTAECLVSSSIRLHKEATSYSQAQASVFSSQASSDPDNPMSSLSHNYRSHPSGVPKSSITPEVHQSQSSQPLSNSVDSLSSSSPIRLRNEDKLASVPIPNPLRNETKQPSEFSNGTAAVCKVEDLDPVSSDGVQASCQVENDLCNEGELGLLHFDEEEGWMIEVFPCGGKVDQK
ncbi:hypothetical protein PGT21_015817 [Puccinia graminis f. sp. tritici]|uniref:Uncharacterized protein n=1 Tax=Puccinia graminis f. sp. tritici TaxID=56615 RepID=A0A5B0MSL6_PUCGR|nr:hypothetical protein PGT21_015817 [Puccinia graminis f. sp. tritici]